MLKKPAEINMKGADMWSFAILLWELETREVPFADLTPMEIGMKVSGLDITLMKVTLTFNSYE